MLDAICCCCPWLRCNLNSATNNDQSQPFADEGHTTYTQHTERNSITRDSIASVDEGDTRFNTIPLDDGS